MAFMLPATVGGIVTISGFIMGYYYSFNSPTVLSDNTQVDTQITIDDYAMIKESDIKKLKNSTLHKDINKQLIEFNKLKLKKINSDDIKKPLTSDEEILQIIREKIILRRNYIIS